MTAPLMDTPLEVKFVAETGVFEGYASLFNVTDSVQDRVVEGAFKRTLQDYRQTNRLPPLLWQHDTKEPIGALREVREDERGLYIKGELFVHDIPRAREAMKLMREGVVTGLSIGYRAKQAHRDATSGARILSDIELLEISLVTFPALEQARITSVKSSLAAGMIPTERDFEAFLREAGLSRKQAKGIISHGYKSLVPREAAEPEEVQLLHALADQIRHLAE